MKLDALIAERANDGPSQSPKSSPAIKPEQRTTTTRMIFRKVMAVFSISARRCLTSSRPNKSAIKGRWNLYNPLAVQAAARGRQRHTSASARVLPLKQGKRARCRKQGESDEEPGSATPATEGNSPGRNQLFGESFFRRSRASLQSPFIFVLNDIPALFARLAQYFFPVTAVGAKAIPFSAKYSMLAAGIPLATDRLEYSPSILAISRAGNVFGG